MRSRRSSAVAALVPSTLFSVIADASGDRFSSLQQFFSNLRFRFGRQRFANFPWKRYLPKILLGIIIIGILAAVGTVVRSSVSLLSHQPVQLKGPIATLTLNREFAFPLKDTKGKELSKLKYVIESADLRDEIIVKGQRMVAVKGRRFLILTIKLTNDYNKALEVSVRDYVRLSIGGNEQELLAADIHIYPVSIQPISTKSTRLGFPINDTDQNLVILIGEINGDKEKVPLAFN